MKNLLRKSGLLIALAVLLALPASLSQVKAQGKVTVTWFVGLGTGTDAAQTSVQTAVVDKFNKSQDKIDLKLNIAASNQVAADALSTLIASGNSPDIVGPVGFDGANHFPGQWLDLQPLVDKTKYDLKQFPDSLVQLYRGSKNELVGIPFAVFPGLIYYNKDLFDEAGLAYPPSKFGDKYKLDGKDVDWTWDVVAQIAKKLTVDSAGNDATNAKFDASKITQFGFVHQFGTIRSEFSTFGGAPVIDPATGKVKLSDAWRAEAKWLYNGLWKDHFIPNATYGASDLLKPSEFASGKVAMARTMLWYTCCIPADAKFKWDLGIVPSYNGNTYIPTDADTFRISKDTKNPDAAFTVLQYLLGEGALDLLTTYGAYPARPDLQAASIKAKADKFPSVTNWAIVPESLKYTAAPGHESDFPNYAKGQQRFSDFRTLLYGDTGKDIDVDKELDKLQSDLQTIVDQAGKPGAAATAAATAAK